jgi:hypothetical protein
MTKLTPLNSLLVTILVALPMVLGCARSAEPDATNELPFGFIDAPQNGATVDRQVQMYGWALDNDGVSDVRLFVDGRYVRSVKVDQARPDLTSIYPSYTSGSDVHGWAVTLPLAAELTSGPHMILAQAVDSKGATRDIGTVTVTLK